MYIKSMKSEKMDRQTENNDRPAQCMINPTEAYTKLASALSSLAENHFN
jgi:hypothetical protein